MKNKVRTDAGSATTSGYQRKLLRPLRGNRTAVVDALQHRNTFAYDTGDRLTTITYPDSTTTGFAYDHVK